MDQQTTFDRSVLLPNQWSCLQDKGKNGQAEAADLKDKNIPKTRRIEPAPTVKKLHNAEVRGSPPILEVDTDATD